MHLKFRTLLILGLLGLLPVGCGEQATTRGVSPDSLPATAPEVPTTDTKVGETTAPTSSVEAQPTTSAPVAQGTALGPVTDRVLAEGPAANGPLPGLLPFNAYASTGAAHFTDGSWAWTVGWSWISANKGTLPDGTPAGYDWSLNLSSVPAGVRAEVPSTATHLMTTSAFEFYSQNSSCEFGEGTATSTSVWVLRGGVVVAVGTLSETVADCAWDARTMSPGEFVETLAGLADCSFGDGKLPTCTAVEPLSSEARAAAEEALRKPGQ